MASVSVIIPCYNSEKTIKETIESVLSQTYQDLEIIIVDDGSTDHSKEVVQSFGSKVTYIFQENGGQAAARNTAIRNAKGKYFAFLDADDLWLPEKIEKQLSKMEETGIDWCYCDCEYFQDNSGISLGTYSNLIRPAQTGEVAKALLMGNFIASPTPIVSRDVFENAGYFDQSKEIQSREDWEEWLRIAMVSEIVYLPEILAKHRIHEESITYMENPDIAFSSHVAVIDKICSQYPDRLMALKHTALSSFAVRFSKSHFLRGNFKQARKLIRVAIQYEKSLSSHFLLMLYSMPTFLLHKFLSIYEYSKRNR